MPISTYFSQKEFDCRCDCDSKIIVAQDLLILLDSIRRSVGVPIIVTSGARCKKHNANTPGAATNSWHVPRCNMLYASDITYLSKEKASNPLDILRLYVQADKHGALGLGLYRGRIHVDMRLTDRARWIHGSWDWSD